MLRTKRVRFTRSVFLDDGVDVEEGSVRDLAQTLADDLIAQGSAVQVNFVSRFFARIWSFRRQPNREKKQELLIQGGSYAMSNVEEKVNELMERAKSCGLRMEFDSGLLIVKQAETHESVKQRDVIEQLGKYLVHVRRLVERRAHGARAQEYRGQKIWSQDYGDGELIGGQSDGTLDISVANPSRGGSRTLTERVENLLILVPDEPVAASEEASTSEAPKKRGFLGF
jgi:hypothetical protein